MRRVVLLTALAVWLLFGSSDQAFSADGSSSSADLPSGNGRVCAEQRKSWNRPHASAGWQGQDSPESAAWRFRYGRIKDCDRAGHYSRSGAKVGNAEVCAERRVD